ncbi:hypothetical protein [uncultured Thiocystis sp.]|jgi:hypothetical protein|uniref:hypothetical protein n=1 Tax=uncultured Thiocystis sp. TaxID=1202134 RepID=UPI0025D8F952|nr:hypothetical protein [uncultured Thiocystis sp.]
MNPRGGLRHEAEHGRRRRLARSSIDASPVLADFLSQPGSVCKGSSTDAIVRFRVVELMAET